MSKIKCAAYCRVSTNMNDQKNSYDNQKSYFERELSKNPELELVNIYADRGISGTKLSRPEFDKMLFDAGLDIVQVTNDDNDTRKDKIKYVTIPSSTRKPLFNKIYVSNTSRFGRNVLIEGILRDLRQIKVYVYFLDLGKTTENDDDITYIQIFQSFDERDSRDKSGKVIFGIQEGIEKGIIHCNSKLYGYKYIKEENRLEIIPSEAEVIRKIFEMYSNGLGIRRIINYLSENDIYTRKGNIFVKSAIKKILENEKYMGINNRGKYDTGKIFEKNTYPKIKEKYNLSETDKIPQIISRELFYKCKELREQKINYIQQKGIYKGTSEYAGLIYCDKCKSVYHKNVDNDNRRKVKKVTHFYTCSLRKKKGKSTCDNPNVKKEQIDQYIDNLQKGYFNRLLEGESQFVISKLACVAYTLLEKLDTDNSDNINQFINKLNELDGKYDNYIELFTSAKLKKVKEKIAGDMEKLETEIDEIKTKINLLSKNNEEILIEVNDILAKIQQFKSIEIKKEYTREEILSEIKRIYICNDNSSAPIIYPIIQTELKMYDQLSTWLNIVNDKKIDRTTMQHQFTKEQIQILRNKYCEISSLIGLEINKSINEINPFIKREAYMF
jgi:DNA invertase Pin-like site-specific DNA recombinase